MTSSLLVSGTGARCQAALLEDGVVRELRLGPPDGDSIVGNIYKARVVRVLPGMQCAFLDIGQERSAFLYAGDLGTPPAREEEEKESAPPSEPLSIQQKIQPGQEIVVQVKKAAMGTKGARVTPQVTLPGRHVVYMPNDPHIGVSRRIEDTAERNRLRALAEEVRPEGSGLIVRTVGEGCTSDELRQDVEILDASWRDVDTRARSESAPALLREDLGIAMVAARDLLRADFEGLRVDTEEEFNRLAAFLERFMPDCRPLLQLDTEMPSLFARYGVEKVIQRALNRQVRLKSGGTIVIEHTEALTAVDVNTGRYVGKKNLEDTILTINLQAAKEIAKQLRLRNIGGIIVIDFIDMTTSENRVKVYEDFVAALSTDPVRTRVLPMSEMGLIELTRKRVRHSLPSIVSQDCVHCKGRGWTRSAYEVGRRVVCHVESTVAKQVGALRLKVRAHPQTVQALKTEHSVALERLETRTGAQITLQPAKEFHVEQYEVTSA